MSDIKPETLEALEQASQLAGAMDLLQKLELALHGVTVIRQDIKRITKKSRFRQQGELEALEIVRQLLATERRELKRELRKQQVESSSRIAEKIQLLQQPWQSIV